MPEEGRHDIYDSDIKGREKEAYSVRDIVSGRRGKILKLLACLAYFLSMVPVVLLALYFFSNKVLYGAIPVLLASAVAGWAMFHSLAIIRPWIKVIFAALVIAGAVYLLSRGDNLIQNAVIGSASFALWMLCFAACKKPALSIFNAKSAMMPMIAAALVQIAIFFLKGDYPGIEPLQGFVGWLGAIWGIIAITTINRMTLHAAALQGQDFKTPKALLSGNSILTAAIIAIISIVSFFDEVKSALKYLLQQILYLVLWIMDRIGSLMQPTEAEQPSGQMVPELLPEAEPQSTLSMIFEQIIRYVILAACAVFLLYLLYIIVKNLIRLIKRIIAYINDLKAESTAPSYIDEEDSAFDLEKIKERVKSSISGFASRFRKKQRLEDMPDNRSKLRFLYQTMLGNFARRNMAVPDSMTPDELYESRLRDQNAAGFISSYNKARYSRNDVADAEVQNAMDVVGKV